MAQLWQTPKQVEQALSAVAYIGSPELATTVFLAATLNKPLLVEGPAGVGKTALAKAIAAACATDLIRLQCYEGLDDARTLYEWEYPKQLLYAQILRDKVAETLAGTKTLQEAVNRLGNEENAFFSERFLLKRPLLQAITAEKSVVLLIDEVDRAEPELEAFFLEVLGEYQVSIPELGTISATHKPLVVLTSNNTRELSDALRRRCLYLWLDFPSKEREAEIVRRHLPTVGPELAQKITSVVERIRALDLKKSPSISETIDWARALLLLNAATIDETVLRTTLNMLLKYEGDIQTALAKSKDLLS